MEKIPYIETPFFSKLIKNYLKQTNDVKPLYHRFSNIKNFELQLQEKSINYPNNHREILIDVIQTQYKHIKSSKKTTDNINKLKQENTFTITTGHQLNLFTGPVYFIYKIVTTLNLCKKLTEEFPDKNFVPIYWMASEDHDFKEINHFYLNDEKIEWETNSGGFVGEISTKHLTSVLAELKKLLPDNHLSDEVIQLFKNSYLSSKTLSEATLILVNELFKEQGLVILDANNHKLKKLFAPMIKDEILNQTAYKKVSNTNKKLKNYHTQVNPRKINLFYNNKNIRERIIKINADTYGLANDNQIFTKEEIINELNNHPEKFSPNVILRPLYQEFILPNLSYVGGGGEIAYWLQLKDLFKAYEVTFPILNLRNSVIIVNEKQQRQIKKHKLSWHTLCLPKDSFIKEVTKTYNHSNYDFTQQKEFLKKQFEELETLAINTHPSFLNAIKAQKEKQINGLNKLESRFLKAIRLQNQEEINTKTRLKEALFPKDSLQERKSNFSEFYSVTGQNIIFNLLLNLDPFSFNFEVVEI